ncbi:MAG: hypothetical protein QNJ89_06830 [Acidimicrobiia bacterium]|nr:hypothetical protein [Acidimicrobiia bacterium]
MRLRILLTVVMALLATACSNNITLGLPACDRPPTDPTGANVLVAQAVPRAAYAPCINSLKLGWDEVELNVESGRASLEIGREFSRFLEVSLTETCDVSSATPVDSSLEGASRYEDLTIVRQEIPIRLIPTGERPRLHALMLAEQLGGTRLDDRPVEFSVDENIDFEVRTRVNDALFDDQYVWIINDLDVEEGTLEMRMTADGEGLRGLTVGAALDRLEDLVPNVTYKGQWFFVFEGGCITYDFDAEGTVAVTLDQDAAEAIGFYDNAALIEAGRRAGYTLIEE